MQRRAKHPATASDGRATAAGTMHQPALFKRKKKGNRNIYCAASEEILLTGLVVVFLLAVSGGLVYEYKLYSSSSSSSNSGNNGSSSSKSTARMASESAVLSEEQPKVPVLPIFAAIPDAERYKRQTLDEHKPSMAGIVAILQDFVSELHNVNQHKLKQGSALEICKTIFDLTRQHLGRFDEAYRRTKSNGSIAGEQDAAKENIPIFPIRNDESIFMSLAAFREDLLADTMRFAFDNAKQPDKLFVGAVVQNCFGKVLDDGVTIETTGLPCRTGVQVIGKNPKTGKDMTKVSDAPPDRNGIEIFCNLPNYAHYCQNGQVRVLYVHEMDSSGPASARYFASKLWGGETYFLQTDSHLMFAEHWDEKYRLEVQAASSYPKAVLSSYPPGFPSNFERDPEHAKVQETPGARLCTCDTRLDDPNPIIRINTGVGYSMHNLPPRPSQIPFIAAGFFFARAEFLIDVPFDPLMPFLFMGEEIALSMRAWTHGWNIYAPRKNLIGHQYRPGRMGLPKFWESVNRLYKPGSGNNQLQSIVIQRVKHMVGYPDASIDKIREKDMEFVLHDIEHYGLGSERSWHDYMEFAHMSIDQEHDVIVCSHNDWCNQGLKD